MTSARKLLVCPA